MNPSTSEMIEKRLWLATRKTVEVSKSEQQREIDRQTKAFLAAGGEVKKVEVRA